MVEEPYWLPAGPPRAARKVKRVFQAQTLGQDWQNPGYPTRKERNDADRTKTKSRPHYNSSAGSTELHERILPLDLEEPYC